MTRQAGPSIVLSVLIVCFFAVALFQHDPPRKGVAAGRPGRSKAVAQASRSKSRGATPSQVVSAAVPKLGSPGLGPRQEPVAWESGSPIVPLKPVSTSSTRPPVGPSIAPAAARKSERTAVTRQPDSAFTVVGADETLADVALRVYGSTEVANSLWRANRDALPRKDSLLAPGAVLRTPVIH